MKLLIILLSQITFFAFSQNQSIYVSDAGSWDNPPWQIMKYDAAGQNPEVFINTHMAWPQDIVFVENQNLVLISNLNSGKINRHDAVTGDFISEFATGLGGPTRMEIGADSLLYVLQWAGDGLVKRFELDGTFKDNFTDTSVNQAIGLDWDAQGNFYVSSYSLVHIVKFNPQVEFQSLFIETNLVGPTNIWFKNDGHLMVSDYDAGALKEFDENGLFINFTATGLSQTEGVDFYSDGSFLVGNGGNSSVKIFNPDGSFIQDFIASGSGGLIRPNAVVLREDPTFLYSKKKEKPFIYPSKGRVFKLNKDLKGNVDTLIVLDFKGLIVKKEVYFDQNQWDLSELKEGEYYILGVKNNETEFQARIFIGDPGGGE
ncbi:MAG: hypothetical protein ACI9G9_000141 [Psychromonas sp.]|jgi:hypothetical protein